MQKQKIMADIKINLTIKAAPGKVYNAITTQEGLSGWWAKQTIARPELDFVNVFTFGPIKNEMKVTKLDANRKTEWIVINSVDEWIDTSISFDLEEKEGNTIVRFAHANWRASTDLFARCTYDWSRFLASLKSLCETGAGSPA
jgi:uncharacterized protein YndB with AHSA1/START domain